MNAKTKFEQLTRNARYVLMNAESTLRDPKRGIQTLSDNLAQIYNQLSWNAEGWMEASISYEYAMWVAKACETALLESLERNGPGPASDLDDALDMRAEQIIKATGDELLRNVLRSGGRSSNSISNVVDAVKHDISVKLLERLCDLSDYDISGNGITVLLADKDARRQAELVNRRKLVTKITYFKKENCDGGGYIAQMRNFEDNVIEYKSLGVTRKGDALTKIAELVKEVQAKQNNQPIQVIQH